MSKGRIIALGVGIAIAIIIGVGIAFSATPPKNPQVSVTENVTGRHLEVNLEEKVGVKANP